MWQRNAKYDPGPGQNSYKAVFGQQMTSEYSLRTGNILMLNILCSDSCTVVIKENTWVLFMLNYLVMRKERSQSTPFSLVFLLSLDHSPGREHLPLWA